MGHAAWANARGGGRATTHGGPGQHGAVIEAPFVSLLWLFIDRTAATR